jgi:hypothetical protein
VPDEPGADSSQANGHVPGPFQVAITKFVGKATPSATVLALIGAGVADGLSNYPGHSHLPGIALNSGALYYTERGVVFFAALMIALTLLGRGLMGELPLKLGFGTGSVEYGQQVQAAAGGVRAAASDLQAWMGDIGSRLATVETSLKSTSKVATATARDVEEHLERAKGPEGHVRPSGD